MPRRAPGNQITMATEMASRMKAIVDDIAPTFKDAGFRKRRHSFNRTATDTVTHVVTFQMGPHEPPGTEEVPGLRHDLYGKFAVNLGVFCTHLNVLDQKVGKWVHEYHCQLRKRLGELVTDGEKDLWWKLDGPQDEVERDVAAALEEHGLPWLDGFPSDEAILERYRADGWERLGMAPRGPLDIAALELALGDRDAARKTAADYLAGDLNPGHRPVAEETVERLGLA